MANVVGRPIAALVPSTGERAYRKRQVRGSRVARSDESGRHGNVIGRERTARV